MEPLNRGLPPPYPLSLCPLSSNEFFEPPPPKKFLGTPLRNINLNYGGIVKFVVTCRRYDPEHHKDCRYNSNTGYVVFSAMGSFFIPLTVMIYVYTRISCVVARRHNHLTSVDNNDQVLCILWQLVYIYTIKKP
jgi:hypothetical protein